MRQFNDFTNSNGLIAGMIPKGVECPFKRLCVFADNDKNMGKLACKRPSAMEKVFSCGQARAFSLLAGIQKEKNA